MIRLALAVFGRLLAPAAATASRVELRAASIDHVVVLDAEKVPARALPANDLPFSGGPHVFAEVSDIPRWSTGTES